MCVYNYSPDSFRGLSAVSRFGVKNLQDSQWQEQTGAQTAVCVSARLCIDSVCLNLLNTLQNAAVRGGEEEKCQSDV